MFHNSNIFGSCIIHILCTGCAKIKKKIRLQKGKQSNLNIIFRATSTIQQQLTEKQTNKNPSGIYKLVCNTCNNVYVGQSGRSINVRHKEHVIYVRTNNPLSAYALHVSRNGNEYGRMEDTLKLLKTCQKGTRMKPCIYKYSTNIKY